MNKFSQRMGFESEPLLQKEDISESLKNKIWNILTIHLFKHYVKGSEFGPYIPDFFLLKYANHFGLNIDQLSSNARDFKTSLSMKFHKGEWYWIYDLVEFFNVINNNQDFRKEINQVLIEENSAYRISQEGLVIPITNEEELAAVDQASRNPYNSVSTHIEKAISHFKSQAPDYANSIKESILAVEAICKIIIEDERATLGKAIKKLKEKGLIIHPVLETAFDKLYGYTSDEGGIRHAFSEGDTPPTFDEAKYMLVACSAFVNYLISKYEGLMLLKK